MKDRSWLALALLLLLQGVSPADPQIVSHADSFSSEGLFKADVSKVKDTQLVAHPDVPLVQNQNIIWCGTMQLAWNKAIDLVGEKLHFVNQPPVVDLLNLEQFTDSDLDADSYVALADFERNNVEDEIRDALEKTFHGAASPELIPPKPRNPGPDDFVTYAYLYKNLAFAFPFENNEPINFGSQPVKNFGFVKDKEKLDYGVFDQVLIYDYQSPDNFIIKLKPKVPGDELILAKIPPGPFLQDTITEVLNRIGGGTPNFVNRARDQLAIPKLNFDLRTDFSELEGLKLQPGPNARIKTNLVIAKAEQLVRFQLDEKGAILKSEAVMIMVGAAAPLQKPLPPHIMIFDKPFLILMKRGTSDRPYFALWVGNPTLLVPAGK